MNGSKAKALRQLVLLKSKSTSGKIEATYDYKEHTKVVNTSQLNKDGSPLLLNSVTYVATLAPCTRLAYKAAKKAYKQAA